VDDALAIRKSRLVEKERHFRAFPALDGKGERRAAFDKTAQQRKGKTNKHAEVEVEDTVSVFGGKI